MLWGRRQSRELNNRKHSEIDRVENFVEARGKISQAGSLDGKHYSASVDRIKALKREKRHDEAIEILIRAVEATEKESVEMSRQGFKPGVSPWYYEQLAIIYRKERRFDDEISILERFARQPHDIGSKPPKLMERLRKAKESAAKRGYA